jgi:hypothetical protein
MVYCRTLQEYPGGRGETWLQGRGDTAGPEHFNIRRAPMKRAGGAERSAATPAKIDADGPGPPLEHFALEIAA